MSFIGLKFRKQTIGPAAEWYTANGDFRAPRQGEHYLSGAIPAVYEALNDLDMPYWIMIRCPNPPPFIIHQGVRYYIGN